MENALRRLARQLDVYDEASLTALWDKLARQVEKFEPTKEWEEAVLMLGMVQAIRWKNQLFNYNWSENLKRKSMLKSGEQNPWPDFTFEESADALHVGGVDNAGPGEKRGKVLSFGPVKNDQTV
ncbi:MAG: hypothetical protein IJD04_00490 [Desulfovibrionaceae bacterium]|nr:hypothetical protein [Desulfovibrionaceae bacterium]